MLSWFPSQLLKILFSPLFLKYFFRVCVCVIIIFFNLAVLSFLVCIWLSQQLQMENFEVSELFKELKTQPDARKSHGQLCRSNHSGWNSLVGLFHRRRAGRPHRGSLALSPGRDARGSGDRRLMGSGCRRARSRLCSRRQRADYI